MDYRLKMMGISKSFGEVQALLDVDFNVGRNEIVGLLGDNGAGKSTLIKILSGAHRATSGEVYVEGRRVDITGPGDAFALGIATLYQELMLLDLRTKAILARIAVQPVGKHSPVSTAE